MSKIKRKGTYEYKGLGWHQNHSSLIIPMAAEYEILGKGAASAFIREHNNIFDFMLRTKVNSKSRLVLVDDEGNEEKLQNICRYYISTEGGKLVKIMPPLYKVTTKYWKGVGGDYIISNNITTEIKLLKFGYRQLDITFEQALQNKELYKQMERRTGINTEWLVQPCNNIKDYKGDINTNYYIMEAKSLINPLKENIIC